MSERVRCGIQGESQADICAHLAPGCVKKLCLAACKAKMPLSRLYIVRLHLYFFLIPLLAVGCSQPASAPQRRFVEAYIPSSGAVGFDLQTLSSPAGPSQWKAVYASHGKTAAFIIDLGPGKRSGSASPPDLAITPGE